MSGHGGFSVIGSGMKVPQPLAMPKVEELQPGKDKRNALNVEGHKAEAQIADTRLDQTNRLAANLDTMLLRAAKTASAPVDVKALKEDGRVVSTDDWGKKDVQRMVAGPKPKPLPAVGGRSPNDTLFAKNVQADVNDLQGSLFRRDLLPHIAKPGWFEE